MEKCVTKGSWMNMPMSTSRTMTTAKKRKSKPELELTKEQRLLEENEELRMENEYLKKLIALTQGREVTYEKQK